MEHLQCKYIRILRIFLMPFGGWPGEILGEHVSYIIKGHRILVPGLALIVLMGQINYVSKFHTEMGFFILGHCVLTSLLDVLSTVRLFLPSFESYGRIMKSFLTNFHLSHFKNNGPYYKKVDAIVDKISYYFTLYLVVILIFCCFVFNGCTVYNNYINGIYSKHVPENATLEFSIYYMYPGYNPFDHFTLTTIFNLYISYNCLFSICGIDLFLSLMVFQIIGHMKILQNNLKILPKPKGRYLLEGCGDLKFRPVIMAGRFDVEENEIIHEKLASWVEHHKMVVEFTDEMSTLFGPVIGVTYAFHLVAGCIMLLECSQGDLEALMRFGPLTVVIIGQLIQLSVTFEIVGTVSEKLKDSVYDIPWECMDTKNQRSVCFILNRVQTPIRITAMGLAPVGVSTMASILKTSFSYFIFLKSQE